MAHYRSPSPKSRWYLPKWQFRTVAAFCCQYPELKARYAILMAGGIKAVNYTGMPHGSGVGDPTAQHAAELAEVSRKIDIIERNVDEVAKDLSYWMIRGITEDDMTFDKLKYECGMPLNKNAYSVMRREIYYKIAQEI